jgi:cell wall-associated NlpC family hydrolase
LNIKKVNDKPMVIHTKEKTKLHIKHEPEAKIKGRNVLVVDKSPKIAGVDKTDMGTTSAKEAVRNSMQKEKGVYAQVQRAKQDREKVIGKKNSTAKAVASAGAMTALDQMDGGNEVYESYQVARTFSAPAESAADAGRRLYRSQVAKAQAKKIKKVQSGKKIGKKAVKDSATKTAKYTAKKVAKEAAKETAKETAKIAAKETAKATAKVVTTTATTTAGTAISPGVGTAIGLAAGSVVGYAASVEMDYKDMKATSRARKLKFFLDKMNAEEQQKDSFAKLVKDLVVGKVSMMIKAAAPIIGLVLLLLVLLVAVVAIPVIAVIAVLYNSPFAIFLPSISTGDTTQNVLSAYVSEFNGDITTELNELEGCDRSEKIYVNFGGEGIPDNYCDILVVYMVKYGDGDTATDMTDKAKENLKSVFDDMCSYTTSTGTETDMDAEGNETEVSVKYVNVTLKTYQDMISEYGFNTEEQEMLAELMKPENLMMLGYSGNSGGQTISPEQYQAIVDAISDANGKKVVEFALSKVGYPYSQELRHSGTHFDCSSLAYYAWKHAGVDIEYLGATTAAYEGQYCYDNNWLVHYDEMQPGDLIFFSYEQNGAFMNISHVAIYVGDGMLVEAANSRIGVVYRQVHSRDSIVMIGRPR